MDSCYRKWVKLEFTMIKDYCTHCEGLSRKYKLPSGSIKTFNIISWVCIISLNYKLVENILLIFKLGFLSHFINLVLT